MLIQSDVCPACGKVHAGRRFGFLGATKNDCPLVVTGSLPSMTRAADLDDPSGLGQPHESPRPHFDSARNEPPLPSSPMARKGSVLTVPWPMPSNLEDYL